VKQSKFILTGLAVIAMITGSSSWAHGHHSHRTGFGVYLSVPLAGPYYYPPSYYYPSYYYPGPPVVMAPAAPTTYIEQEKPPASGGYWYYCRNPQGYYPYVKNCLGSWQPVAPQPTSPP
jgi:hypothetical protein